MKYISLVFLLALAFGATPKPAPKAKPIPYDPDKLPPLEVSCGRPTAARNSPCECMKARNEAVQKEREQKCGTKMGLDRAKCEVSINECPEVTDQDSPSYNSEGYPMTVHCKRSCKQAKCECCKT
jgi:hypothetical protein